MTGFYQVRRPALSIRSVQWQPLVARIELQQGDEELQWRQLAGSDLEGPGLLEQNDGRRGPKAMLPLGGQDDEHRELAQGCSLGSDLQATRNGREAVRFGGSFIGKAPFMKKRPSSGLLSLGVTSVQISFVGV